jgi:hypothetical protein
MKNKHGNNSKGVCMLVTLHVWLFVTGLWMCSLGKLFSYSVMSLATYEKRNASVNRITRDRI